MKRLRYTLFATLFFFFGALAAQAGDHADWSENYSASLATAKKENKPVLLLFTGSDWCPPCKYMEGNVFASDAFNDYATEHLVLVKADFPRGNKPAAAVVEQNEKLAEQYGIEGFPTMIVLSPEGKELERVVGARLSTPDAFLGMLKKATKQG